MSRFECHAHTDYSNIRLLDCISKTKNLINYAVEIGLKGICITDHESLGAHVEANKIQKELIDSGNDFKVGLGDEIYLINDREPGQKYFHFILIAKDAIGHKILREVSSTAWINSYFDRRMERVPILKSELKDIVLKYGKNHLIASSACLGSEIDYCILKMHEAEQIMDMKHKREYYNQLVDFIKYCIDLFGEDFYLEVQPAQSEDQLIVNNKMKQIADYFNIKMIVTTDAHYLKKEDREIHKAYLNSKGGEREVDSFYEFAYLQTTEEVIDNLRNTCLDYYELERNTQEIYDKIEFFDLHKKQKVSEIEVKCYPKKEYNSKYPTLNYLYNSDNIQERYWVNQCVDKLKEIGKLNDTYLSRLEEEADIQKVIGDKLETCMFAYPIFLQHYIDLIWESGSTVGAGRGSACSGLNHYLLGVTQLDPVQWNLPYFRYLNKDRVEIGDIDIDICPSKRELIFDKIREERGELGCVQVCTYGTETTKSAIKTACRGYRSEKYPDGIDIDIAEYMTSLIPQERGFLWDIQDVINGNEEKGRKPVKLFINEVNKYKGLLDIIINIQGLICRRGIHASGTIFYGEDPYETACFMKAKNGAVTTQYSLHDAEYCSDVKFDFLVTEIQDVIVQCLEMLQEYNQIDTGLTLRELYNKYIHPDVLPINDKKLWDACCSGSILKEFQFDSQVGSQTIKLLKPSNPDEMSLCNGIMRLMATEKGGETPTERYYRLKNNPYQWTKEMNDYGLTEKEQNKIKEYVSNGVLVDQESLMLILMDKDICGFTLAESNAARKTVAKKQMNKINELHKEVLDKATSKSMGNYVWFLLAPSMGYSFSRIHGLAYSFVGLQTVYLATYFPSVYWNTACLRIDSGLDEEASSNYNKIAKAVGNMINKGIKISLIDINKSQYMFEPNEETNSILYGMKALNGVGGDIIQNIIDNRPYISLEDFISKINPNKTVMVSLIKSGAFDQFGERSDIMKKYIWSVCNPKKRITLQNFNGLSEKNLIPSDLTFQKRVFRFNKALKKNCAIDGYYVLKNSNYYVFYEKFFDMDLLEPLGNKVGIKEKLWKKQYDKAMLPAKEYFKVHQKELLDKINKAIFQEMWNKYANGSYSKWEMDSLGMYYHSHELSKINLRNYDIIEFKDIPENPEVEYTFTRNGIEIPVFKNYKIAGTVIAKDDSHSSISVLTVHSGVINVKMNRDYFAMYNRRISEKQEDGKKKVVEQGWFQKGTLVILNGIRRGDLFITKSRKRKGCEVHQLYKITSINKDGSIEFTNERYEANDE